MSTMPARSDAARKVVLPQFTLTQASDRPVEGVLPVTLPQVGGPPFRYYPVPVLSDDGERIDGRPQWVSSTYRLFPVVLSSDGSPWAEANLWLLSMMELKTLPNMLTFASLAEDLAAYRRYIEDEEIAWLRFDAHKLRRPTYRYNGSLRLAVEAGEVSPSVAKRRMATVIRLYRWLMQEANFRPLHSPWVESDRHVGWKDERGFSGATVVKTTDVSLRTPSASDPWDDHIVDGGRLRPLPQEEQRVLVECLQDLGNTEMTLIHLFSLVTGARIQSVLTVRVKHVLRNPEQVAGSEVRLKSGPGTGIDTKGGKHGVLHLPKWFYLQLHTYALSERARERRLKAEGGDCQDQFLFLSHRGAAFYDAQLERHQAKRDGQLLRHVKTGQGVRQFMLEKLLPGMRRRLGRPQYTFKFHDLRATFGMNVVDSMTPLLDARKLTYSQALDQLRQLLWHASTKTTEGYLQFRVKHEALQASSEGWSAHLAQLARRAVGSDTGIDASH